MVDNNIASNIEARISAVLDKTGIYYRIFSRQKSEDSIKKKLESKKDEYSENGKKMQDFVGIRVVFYFKDDIDTFLNILRSWDSYDTANESNSNLELFQLEDTIRSSGIKQLENLVPLTDKVFMPERMNLVMKMDKYETELFLDLMSAQTSYNFKLIDNTYEIQLRTVLSEGWHEVEHDLRYKTRKETWWNECQEESRLLNGIYAALISNESQLASIVDDIAYKAYLNKEWDTMIRFHFRRRTKENKLSTNISTYLNGHKEVAKRIYRFNRNMLVDILNRIPIKMDITTDLIAFVVNRYSIRDNNLLQMEPTPIRTILDKTFNNPTLAKHNADKTNTR